MAKTAAETLPTSFAKPPEAEVSDARSLIRETEERLRREIETAEPDNQPVEERSDRSGRTGDREGSPAAARWVPVDHLSPGPARLRRAIDPEALAQLADTIQETGLLQPLLVRPDAGRPGRFEIVAGERRWRAAQLAGATEVPVMVGEFTDRAVLESALIENLQREELKPLEVADAYQRLIAECQHTQETLARIVGKSRSHVANTLRLLNLSPTVQQMVQAGELSAGHARVLLGTAQPEGLAQRVVAGQLSVRQTERLARGGSPTTPHATSAKPKIDRERVLVPQLSAALGKQVTACYEDGRCGLTIHCANAVDLTVLIDRLERILSGNTPATEAPPTIAPTVAASRPTHPDPKDRDAAGQNSARKFSQDQLKELAAEYGYPWP